MGAYNFEKHTEKGQHAPGAHAPAHMSPCRAPSRAWMATLPRLDGILAPQEPSQLLNAILPLYLNGQLLRTLQESVASELASRMSAMQSATDNAKLFTLWNELAMNCATCEKIPYVF